MTLDDWDWFITLSEQESFTKAAERMRVSQQTLSARLSTLERSLDVKLIARGNPLKLTPAGMVFLLYAREQRQSQQDMLRQIGEVTGNGVGVLKVGVAHMRSQLLMPKVTALLVRELPQVKVEIHEGTNRDLLRMAEHAEVDAVIARFDDVHPGVEVTPLYDEEIVLALRADLLEKTIGLPVPEAVALVEREGVSALSTCPFVLGSLEDIVGRVAYSVLRNAGIKPRTVASSTSITTLLTMAKEGVGAAFCPTDALSIYDSAQDLVRISLSKQARYTISLGIPQKHEHEEWRTLSVFKSVLSSVIAQL